MKFNSVIKYTLILFTFLQVINCGLFAQEDVKIRKREFYTKDEGFREAWKAIKKGNKYYKFDKSTYRKAREYYLKAYNYNDKNTELNYKIGITYLYADDKFEAIKYLKKAYEFNVDITDDIHLQLGRAYHMSLDFDNAIKEYKEFLATTKPKKLKKFNINIDALINECETGKKLIKQPVRVIAQNLGKNVNSEYDDYYPVVDSKETTLYFTSRRNEKAKRTFMDKKFPEDIYVSYNRGKEWGKADVIKKIISKKNEAVVGISPDGKQLYIYKSKGNGNIYISTLKNGKWRSPSKFRKINTRKYRETSLSITEDGKKIYFVSDRDIKTAVGGKDIYYTEQNSKGRWSKPKNIGVPINTNKNEEGVYISRDGKTLYFSSKGHSSMGGYDIFYSKLDSFGAWSKPENIGYPINTPDDDLFFSMLENGKAAYVSSIREAGIGEKDIYKIIFLGSEKEMVLTYKNSPFAFEKDKKTLLRKPVNPLEIDSALYMKGKILDEETLKPVLAKLEVIDSDKGEVLATLISDTSGTYKVRIPKKKPYGIQISAKGYLLFLDIIDLAKEPGDQIIKDFKLQPLEVGAKVVMKSIFFETGKANLKMESFQQLDNVVMFLKDNSTVKLEISGHTDNVGSKASNMKLSEARARSVVEYMVKQGIDRARLTYKGYGPDQPIAPNNTKEGKAQNRRVEFKITGK
jgi:outer membrane protein OmpA-like peptidoglycan-associated protein/tetratricopeptide (TPR) repeat protein